MCAGLGLLTAFAVSADPRVLVDEDFRNGPDEIRTPGWVMLADPLPGTGIRPVPARETLGVPHALVRSLREAPLWPDGRLQIARNEVGQGMHRVMDPPVPLNPAEEVLVMRMTTFADATTGGTNSIAVRLWVQSGPGPNDHRERMELSTHFNAHARGSRQVYPNAYTVRDGWETWAMPEGINSRRAGIYYRLAAEGRNEDIRSREAVDRGFYWTWQGLDWRRGWLPPLGGALYPPPEADGEPFPGGGIYTTTAVFARADVPLSFETHRFRTRVDVLAPRKSGRVVLDAPLPESVDEVRLLLRSETPGEGREWLYADPAHPPEDPLLGVADVRAVILSRADVNLDGQVDADDWHIMRDHAGKTDALHTHGDVTGDGRVDLEDAFFLAARLRSELEADTPPAEKWRAQRDEQGNLQIRIPPGGRLYGWQLQREDGPMQADGLTPLFTDEAMRIADPEQIGEMDLANPLTAGEEGLTLSAGVLAAPETGRLYLRIQTAPGQSALRLPVN